MTTRSFDIRTEWGRIRTLLALAVLAAVVVAPTSALAGAQEVDMDHPQVWPGVTVNAVVVPYLFQGDQDSQLGAAALELSKIAYLSFFQSILKYRSIGAVLIAEPSADTARAERVGAAESVLDKLLDRQPGARKVLSDGGGIVLLSGLLFEEGSRIYVQSDLRFQRRDRSELIRLVLDTPDGPVNLAGHLPAQRFTFAPRELSDADITGIGTAFRRGARLYDRPDDDGGSRLIESPPGQPFAYLVTDMEGRWMHIVLTETGQSGWIKADTDLGAQALNRKLPELNLAEALTGYLRFRVAVERDEADFDSDRLAGKVIDAIDRYELFAGKQTSPDAAAMAETIRAVMLLLTADGKKRADRVADATRAFTAAAKLAPYSADAVNLEAMARIYHGYLTGWTDEDPRDIEKSLRRGLALDTRNREIVANLEALYRLLEQGDTVGETPAWTDLTEKQQKVHGVKSTLANLVEISWPAVDEAQYYIVEIMQDGDRDNVMVLNSRAPEMSVDVEPGRHYQWRVCAVDAYGVKGAYSSWSRSTLAKGQAVRKY